MQTRRPFDRTLTSSVESLTAASRVEPHRDKGTRNLKTASEATRVCLVLAIVCLLSGTIGARASEKPEGTGDQAVSAGTLSDIEIFFKLDAGLTRGLYMGDRWVSPPTFLGIQDGQEITIAARAQGIVAGGKRVIMPAWIPADPNMVMVMPAQGNQVLIRVKGSGVSSLEVTSHGFSKKLSIKAEQQGSAIRVEIAQ